MKKIAFGCTLLNRGLNGPGIDGIGHYCQELLVEHKKFSNQVEMLPYSFGHPDLHSKRGEYLYSPYPLHLITALSKLPSIGRGPAIIDPFSVADLIHAPDHLIPLIRNSLNGRATKTPIVATIMDVIPISHPQFIRSKLGTFKANLWRFLASRVDHIITISEFSKFEIAKHLHYPLEKISVTPLGVNVNYAEKGSAESIKFTLDKYLIPKNFFLFIGTIQPRKNLIRTLEAHAALPDNLAQEFPLVIAGRLGWDDGMILNAIHKAIQQKHCLWINYINEEEKRSLLQAATGVAFMSLYEGFGLPMIEAFASGTPVIASNTTALAEIGNNAALLIDPLSHDEITNAFHQLITNHSFRENLKRIGQIKANEFSWKKTWDATCDVYKKILS